MNPIYFEAVLGKMRLAQAPTVQCHLATQQGEISLHDKIGWQIELRSHDHWICQGCKVPISEPMGEGYCKKCFFSLACCDRCITSPSLCHWQQGTCREPEWGEEHCRIPHTVYLAQSSGLKVGITRAHQRLTRWMDQGAMAAIPLLRVPDRLMSGLWEARIASFLSDRSDWRKLITEEPEPLDLIAHKLAVAKKLGPAVKAWLDPDNTVEQFHYPVQRYLAKAKSAKLGPANPILTGILRGIRGQYLIFDQEAINIRKYSGLPVTGILTPAHELRVES